MRRTTGDIEIYRNYGIQVANNLVTAMERTTGDRTAATGNDNLGGGNRSVGCQKSCMHIP